MNTALCFEPPPRRLHLVSPPEPPRPPKPPPPAPETLQGIGSGIREILVKVDGLGVKHERLSEAVGRVEYKQNEQGYRIVGLERGQEEIKETLADHRERIVELERLPKSRPPYPSGHLIDDEEEEDYTSPGGHLRVSVQTRQEERRRAAAMERALNDLRQQVDAESMARDQERKLKDLADARARGAEDEKERIRLQGIDDLKTWDRRLRLAKLAGGIIAAVGTALVALVHFLHL
jgi:hypothetical protein